MEMYRASFGKIERVEVVRKTAKFVIVNGAYGERRESKTTDWFCYRDTFQEAKDWIISIKKESVLKAERSLKFAKDELIKAENINDD